MISWIKRLFKTRVAFYTKGEGLYIPTKGSDGVKEYVLHSDYELLKHKLDKALETLDAIADIANKSGVGEMAGRMFKELSEEKTKPTV